jgi:hypothetical protein
VEKDDDIKYYHTSPPNFQVGGDSNQALNGLPISSDFLYN